MDIATNTSISDSIPPELTLRRLFDGRGFALTVNSLNRPAAQAFFDQITAAFRAWPPDQPVFALYELHFNLVGISPYARHRTLELHQVHVELGLKVYCAIVVPNTVAAQVLNVFIRFLADKLSVTRFFSHYDEAVQWLESNLPSSPPVPST